LEGAPLKTITRDELKQMIDRDDNVTVAETLDEMRLRKFHLPGAINAPPGGGFDERIRQAVPENEKPVVVCWMDEECETSPKAAHEPTTIPLRGAMAFCLRSGSPLRNGVIDG
jgi:hypothetical protein